MPLPLDLIGATTDPITQTVDARWTMAYAAALDDVDDRYFDTRHGSVLAHPLFPVCVEWPAVRAVRKLVDPAVLTAAEAARGVHATHDLLLHRPVRSDDVLTTTATVEHLAPRRPGTYQVLRLDTVDASGAPVATTWMGSLFLGVDIIGIRPDDEPARPTTGVPPAALPSLPRPPGARSETVRPIAATAAHVYTECSRIWNPIHTDVAVAERAGLPAPILHGTATLALAVSEIVHTEAGGDPASVERIACRFGAMVLMPSRITVRIQARHDRWIAFEVLDEQGRPAIRDGLVGLRT